MYHAIKFCSNHYQALRSRFKSRKVGRISAKIARYRPFFLLLQHLLIRVGPFINLFPLHYISNYYFRCFGLNHRIHCEQQHKITSQKHHASRATTNNNITKSYQNTTPSHFGATTNRNITKQGQNNKNNHTLRATANINILKSGQNTKPSHFVSNNK